MAARYLNRSYMDEGGVNLARSQHAVNRLLYAAQQAGYFPGGRTAPIVGIGTQAPGAEGQVVDNGRVLELSPVVAAMIAGAPPKWAIAASSNDAPYPMAPAEVGPYMAKVAKMQQAKGLPVLLHELAHTQQALVRNPGTPAPRPAAPVRNDTVMRPGLPSQAAVEGGASAFEHMLGQQLANRAGFGVRLRDSSDAGTSYGTWRKQVGNRYGSRYVSRGQFR